MVDWAKFNFTSVPGGANVKKTKCDILYAAPVSESPQWCAQKQRKRAQGQHIHFLNVNLFNVSQSLLKLLLNLLTGSREAIKGGMSVCVCLYHTRSLSLFQPQCGPVSGCNVVSILINPDVDINKNRSRLETGQIEQSRPWFQNGHMISGTLSASLWQGNQVHF